MGLLSRERGHQVRGFDAKGSSECADRGEVGVFGVGVRLEPSDHGRADAGLGGELRLHQGGALTQAPQTWHFGATTLTTAHTRQCTPVARCVRGTCL